MSGAARELLRISRSTDRRREMGALSDELRAHRYGGDFSLFAPILPGSDLPPSSTANCDKDLPRIPTTSTVSTFTEMGSPTASPIVACPPLPVPSHQVYKRTPITEAQRIANRYRQRYGGSLDLLENATIFEQGDLDVSINHRYMRPPRAS